MKDQVELDGLEVFPKKLVTLRSRQRRNRYMDISPKKSEQPKKTQSNKPSAKVSKRQKKSNINKPPSKQPKKVTLQREASIAKSQPKKRKREEERVVVSPIADRPRKAKAKALARDY